MFRYLVAHIPTFRLDRCGWNPDQAAILVSEQKNALRVVSATSAAFRYGIRTGMSVAAARSHLPDIETERLDSDSETADLNALTEQLLRISPVIAALPPDAMVAEISRQPESRAGHERALVERIRIRLNQLGHNTRVVVASDPHTALTIAKWSHSTDIIPPGEERKALASLPLTALELPLHEHALLTGLGLSTIGDFAALPPSTIVGRLGPISIAAHALASGRSTTPALTSWSKDGPIVLRQDLPAPVSELDALLFVINALVRELTTRLASTGHATAQLEIGFGLDGGRYQSIHLRLGTPTRDPSIILERIRHRLEHIKLGGPALHLTLTLPHPTPFDGHQIDLRDPHRTDETIDNVTARLQDALGSRSVLSARTIPRHRPEGAWRPVPFGTTIPSDPGHAAQALAHTHHNDPVDAWLGYPQPPQPDRPPILLAPPQAIEIEPGPSQDVQPVSAIHVDGRWQTVASMRGPEQISGEWWSRPFQRTYWQTTLEDGRTAWLYREHGRWVVHGWWDR
jgi:protein ImuB